MFIAHIYNNYILHASELLYQLLDTEYCFVCSVIRRHRKRNGVILYSLVIM